LKLLHSLVVGKNKYALGTLVVIICGILYFTIGTTTHDAEKEFADFKQKNIAKIGNNITLLVQNSKAELTPKIIQVFGEVDQGAVLVTSPISSAVQSVQNEGVKLNKGNSVVRFVNGVTIPIPFNGTVLNIFVKDGENINAGSNLFIALPSVHQKTEVNLDLPIAYVNEITKNMNVKILYNSREFSGKVDHISRFSSKQSGFVKVVVVLKTVETPHNAVVKALIEISKHYTHFVPKTALILKDGQTAVKVLDAKNLVQTKTVEVISENSKGFYISGLEKEERIIIRNPFYATDGKKYNFTIINT